MLVVGSEQEMRHEVQEDKDACTCTESHMHAALFNTEAFTHRAFNVKAIVLVFSLLEHARSSDNIGIIEILQDEVFLVRDSRPRSLD